MLQREDFDYVKRSIFQHSVTKGILDLFPDNMGESPPTMSCPTPSKIVLVTSVEPLFQTPWDKLKCPD